MSDLCYNCGDCHLPRPCAAALKHCEICDNFGHTYNFCPLSVRQKDPTNQFWALCHNCDKWHLPDACPIPLHRCHVCNHGGHKEFFCPIKPVPRGLPSGLPSSAGVKRQRTNGSDVSEAEQVTPEMVQKIKTDTAINIFAMLSKNYSHEDIMRNIAPNMVHMVAANPRMVAQNGAVPDTPTPAPAQIYSTRTENTPGLYSIMQDRFERGDIKLGPTQNLVHHNGSQYAENIQPTGGNLAHHNGSHYAESFQSARGNVRGSGDSINVAVPTALQELASAGTSAVTSGPSGSLVATASGNSIGPVSQAENFKEHLENAIATSVGDYNAGIPSLANAMQSPSFASVNTGTPTPGFNTNNVTAGENMLAYQTHTMPPPPPAEDSIAVGTTQPEQPPLLLRKDGKPRKKQPARVQPPRKKAA